MKPKKKTSMRTRSRARSRQFQLVLASLGVATMFTGGHAKTEGREALGDLIRQSDRPLAACLDEAKCAWENLETYFEDIVRSEGKRHKLDSSQISTARSMVSAIKTKMDAAKSTFESSKSSLSIGDVVEDAKEAAALLKCLEKGICQAQELAAGLEKQLSFTSGPKGSKPPKPKAVGKLERIADLGEDLMGESLENLIAKSKSKQKKRKAAAKKKCAKRGGRYRAATGFETGRKISKRKAKKKKAKAKRKKGRKRGPESGAKPEKNTYLSLETTGKNPDADGFVFDMLALELTGDIEAHADIGLFAETKKAFSASGDGEQGCLEISTVGSGDTEAFHSMCVRRNATRGGVEAYVLTPSGAGAITFLPGVEVAELRMQIQSGIVTYDVRDADVRGAWTQVDQRAAPAEPLTIAYGASLLGTGDAVGIDNLIVESMYAE